MGLKRLKTESKKTKKLDALKTSSDTPGMAGLFETFIRKFRTLSFTFLLSPVIFLCCFCMGISMVPGLLLFDVFKSFSEGFPSYIQYPLLGCSIAFGYFLYGISMIFIVPIVNFLMPFKVKPFKGIWFSLPAIPWYIHNALTYIVRYTFLEFITPTPLNVLFFRMMGMKIGKGVVINTTNISDPCMITLEDYVTIGGSAHIFAHYGQKGILIIAPVIIKKGATIGLKASVMGDVIIGEKSLIKPHTVVLPKTRVADGEIV